MILLVISVGLMAEYGNSVGGDENDRKKEKAEGGLDGNVSFALSSQKETICFSARKKKKIFHTGKVFYT